MAVSLPVRHGKVHTNHQQETNSAAHEVLGSVPELLETVLYHLPLTDLLLAQRVSRTWRAAIQQSPKLQRALFITPVPDKMLVPGIQPRNTAACADRLVCDRESRDPASRLVGRPLSHESHDRWDLSLRSIIVNRFATWKFLWLFCDDVHLKLK